MPFLPHVPRSVSTTMAQQGLFLPLYRQRVEAKGGEQSRHGAPNRRGRAAAQSRRLSLEALSPPQDLGCVKSCRSHCLVKHSDSFVASGIIRLLSSFIHKEAEGRQGLVVCSGRSSGSSSGLAGRHVLVSGVLVPELVAAHARWPCRHLGRAPCALRHVRLLGGHTRLACPAPCRCSGLPDELRGL